MATFTALIDRIARGPAGRRPVRVWTTFNRQHTFTPSPWMRADRSARPPISSGACRLIVHPVDAALVTFDMFAEAAGLDPASVTVERAGGSMGGQVADMQAGPVGRTGSSASSTRSSPPSRRSHPAADLRFIDYADHLPRMYGNTLFVTRELHRDRSGHRAGSWSRALNRGLADTARDPDAPSTPCKSAPAPTARWTDAAHRHAAERDVAP